jgi:Glycosyl hydrolases family 8.
MNGLVKMAMVPAFAFGLAQATVNFPYPQSTNYGGNGIVLSNQAEAATELKAAFEYYLKDKYKESGNYAAIEKDHGSNTYVSEGTGYGMLMMVISATIRRAISLSSTRCGRSTRLAPMSTVS